MDYEKKYKNALAWAREVMTGETGFIREEVVEVFPELQESEDEEIRQAMINFFKSERIKDGIAVLHFGVNIEKMIAWLEKQGKLPEGFYYVNSDGKKFYSDTLQYGNVRLHIEKQKEQKSYDKVEPKFKVGDWVVYKNDICQIVKREEGCNKLVTTFGIEKELVNERNLSTARLWTIQDAKDGDVLAASDNSVFIFSHCEDGGCFHHVALANDGIIALNKNLKTCWETKRAARPATKEQRDILFQKMHEAGYEWDAEKKELRKIDIISEPKTTHHEGWVNIFKCGLCYSVWDNIYPTKEDALNDIIEGDEGDVYITTIKIEWEEQQ